MSLERDDHINTFTQILIVLLRAIINEPSLMPQPVIQIVMLISITGSSLQFDPFPVYESYFDKTLSSNYGNPAVAMDAMLFVRDNLETLCYRTSLLFRYFPNMLKVCYVLIRTFW